MTILTEIFVVEITRFVDSVGGMGGSWLVPLLSE
jgi:hypothetical protein